MKEALLKQRLIEEVKEKLTGAPGIELNRTHIEKLEKAISLKKSSDGFLSSETLRRNFGVGRKPTEPSTRNCNIYAFFLGYEDFAAFIKEVLQEGNEGEISPDDPAEDDIQDELLKLVAKNKLNLVFDKLIQVKSPAIEDIDIISLSGRFNDVKDKEKNGTVSLEYINQEKARIRIALIDLIKSM